MSDALRKIAIYFQDFLDGITRLNAATVFSQANLLDTVNRLARLKDRYLVQRDSLSPSERKALFKVFEDDPFIDGMIASRQIGEHVIKRGGAIIRTPDNAPIELHFETSAMGFFGAPRVEVLDREQKPHFVDHIRHLEETAKRVGSALRRAQTETDDHR